MLKLACTFFIWQYINHALFKVLVLNLYPAPRSNNHPGWCTGYSWSILFEGPISVDWMSQVVWAYLGLRGKDCGERWVETLEWGGLLVNVSPVSTCRYTWTLQPFISQMYVSDQYAEEPALLGSQENDWHAPEVLLLGVQVDFVHNVCVFMCVYLC